jgi:hypothetical protein
MNYFMYLSCKLCYCNNSGSGAGGFLTSGAASTLHSIQGGHGFRQGGAGAVSSTSYGGFGGGALPDAEAPCYTFGV